MSNPLQNPRRGLAERKEDNRNAANRQQCTAVACTGEQHVDNLRPKHTDTNRRRHRNNHGNAVGQCHFSAHLLPLLQLHRCCNARQSRCCNRRRNRNGQCGQRDIFPGKLSVQSLCVRFGKSNLLQNSYHHPHINQVGDAEYRRTCDDGPCRLQNSAHQLTLRFLVGLLASLCSPKQIRANQTVGKDHHNQTCQSANPRPHRAAGRCQRNVFRHPFRNIDAHKHPCQIHTEKGVEHLLYNLRNRGRHHGTHPLEISAEYGHDSNNHQSRAKRQQGIIAVRNVNHICQSVCAKSHHNRKERAKAGGNHQCRLKDTMRISVLLQCDSLGNQLRNCCRQSCRGQNQQKGIDIVAAGINRIPLVPNHIG